MILLIDIGNTRLKWATLEAGQLIPGGSLLYKDIPTDDILWQNWAFPVAPEAVFISSVSSKGVVKAFKQTFLEHWAVEPIRIQSEEISCGVINAYDSPSKLGTDRWLGVIAAHALYEGPSVVIDLGTASTVDLVSETGQHLGGLIVPGLTMMKSSLMKSTAQVSLDEAELSSESWNSLLAGNTLEAVEGGAIFATVSFIDRVVSELEAEMMTSLTRIITGGDCLSIEPLLEEDYHIEPNWILKGMQVWVEENYETVKGIK